MEVCSLMLCLASLTRIWDLSLEKDEEEEAEFRAKTKEQVNAPEDLPPQLLFVHQVIPLPFSNFPLSEMIHLENSFLVQHVNSTLLWL
jgi:hypothetical protein